MPVSERTIAAVVLEDPEGQWELHEGRLREKPAMSVEHNRAAMGLARQLIRQLDFDAFEVRVNLGRVRRSEGTSYVPDVYVVPVEPRRVAADDVEVFRDPLPLIVEVWSPSTGGYGVDAKLPGYRERGDLEIWRLHPFERTLMVWRRQPDGAYAETVFRGGTVRPVALPEVTIELDALVL